MPVCSAIFLLGPCLKTANDKMGCHHFVNQHIQEFHEWTQLMLCSKYSKYKMMIFRIVCWRKGKGLYPRGRWDLHTKSIWKGGLKKWPLNGNQITLGYTQLDIFNHMSLWTIEKEGCRKWPLKGKQITGRGIFSVVLTRRGYTGHRTQLWTSEHIQLTPNSAEFTWTRILWIWVIMFVFFQPRRNFEPALPRLLPGQKGAMRFLHKQRVPFLR